MKKLSNLKLLIFLIIFCFCSSCASIFNKKVQQVNIHSEYPYTIFQGTKKLIIDPDTTAIAILRSKNKLKFDVLVQDSLQSVYVKPHISPLIFLNLMPSITGVFGVIVDGVSNKSRDYPKNIYLYQSKNQVYFLPFKKEMLELKNNLKLTSLRLFDFANPTFEFSYERKLSDRYSLQVLYGQIFNYNEKQDGLVNSPDLKIRGNRKAIELKKYLKKSAPIGPYISLEYSRLNSNSDKIMSFDKNNPDSLFLPGQSYNYEDTIKVNRKINTLNLKFGYQIIRNKTSFDFFIGSGIRNRNVTHSNRFNNADQLTKPRHGSLYYSINRPGSWYTGSLAFNFKIGLAF